MSIFNTNRTLSSVFNGLKKSLAAKIYSFQSKRKLNQSSDLKMDLSDDEKKLRTLVEDLIAKKGYEKFYDTLKKTFEYNENELTRIQNTLHNSSETLSEEQKSLLEASEAEYLHKTLSLKDQLESIDAMHKIIMSESHANKLEVDSIYIEEKALSATQHKKNIDASLEKLNVLIENPEKNVNEITSIINKLKDEHDKYKEDIKAISTSQKEYEQLSGFKYYVKYESIRNSSSLACEVYKTFAYKMAELNETNDNSQIQFNEKDREFTNKPSLQLPFETMAGIMPSFFKNSDEFIKIKDEINHEIEELTAHKNAKIQLSTDIKNVIINNRDSLIQKLASLDIRIKDEYNDLNKQIESLAKKYPTLSESDIYEIKTQAFKEEPLFPNLNSDVVEYLVGKDFQYFDSKMINRLYENISRSIKEEYPKTSFEIAYGQTKTLIEELQKDSQRPELGMKIEFNEEDQILKINFINPIINYETPIVSPITLEKMKTNEEETIKEYTTKAENIIEEFLTYYLNCLSKLQTPTYRAAEDNLKQLAAQYPNLTNSQINNAYSEANQKVYSKYSKEELQKFKFIEQELIPTYNKIDIASLRNLEYNAENFKEQYDNVVQSINKLEKIANLEENKKYNINVKFNEEDASLYVMFNSNNLQDFGVQIINNKTYQAMKSKTTEEQLEQPSITDNQTSSPQPETTSSPKTSEMIKDEQTYLERLRILNENIVLLNTLNLQIESEAIEENFIYPSNRTFIKNAIALENKARELENTITNQKIQLSNLRLDYTNKYHNFIYSVPEIKNCVLEEIKFSGQYEQFIETHDRLIVEAENVVIELSDKQKSDPENEQSYANDINELLTFIEAQNSSISRRLVIEANRPSVNMLEILEKRRQNKRNLREIVKSTKIEDVMGNAPINESNDQVTTAPEAPTNTETTVSEPTVAITNKKLVFNPRKVPKIKAKEGLVLRKADTLTISLIKNGIKIKYSQNLAKKLHEFKAKIDLVNKQNYHKRVSTKNFTATDEEGKTIPITESELTFKNQDAINPADYKVEIRVPEGVRYEYDLNNLDEDTKGKSL